MREASSRALGDVVPFTPVPGQGTRVEVPPTVDEGVFQKVTRGAIASAKPGKRSAEPAVNSQQVALRATVARPQIVQIAFLRMFVGILVLPQEEKGER